MYKSRSQWRLAAVALALPLALLTACAPGGDGSAGPGSSGEGDSGFGGALGTPEQEAAFAELYAAAQAAGESEIVGYGPPPPRVVVDAFQTRFPGIQVNYQQMQGAERIAKLEQEMQTGNHAGDVASDGRTPIVSMSVNELCQPIEPIMDVPEEWMGPDSRSLFPYVSIFGTIVNTDLLDPADAPSSWEELTAPEWAGEIVTTSPAAGGAAAFAFAMMLTPEENATQYAGIMEGARDNFSFVSAPAMVPQEVAQGTYPVGALAFYPYVLEAQAQGAPIEFLFPFAEGGGNLWTKSGECVIANAPHPNAANLWVNWLMSVEGQGKIAEAGWYPTMPDMAPPAGLPPLDEVDLIEQLSDLDSIEGYAPHLKEVITFFGG